MSKTHYLSLFPNSSGPILPGVENIGRLFYKTADDIGLYVCTPTGWQKVTATDISINWEDIANKPAVAPAVHTHQIPDIGGLVAALAAKVDTVDIDGKEDKINKGAINGYAPLGATKLVPVTNLGSGTANNTTYLRGDGTWGAISGDGILSSFTATPLNGIITSITNANSAPNLTIGLGDITPTSVNTPTVLHSSGITFAINSKPQISINATGASFFGGIQETVTTSTLSSSAYTVNLSTGTLINITLTANCVYTFPAPATSKGAQFTIIQLQGTTARTVTWPASVKWAGGTAPTITATANKTDVLSFVSNGTYWLGFVSGLNYTLS